MASKFKSRDYGHVSKEGTREGDKRPKGDNQGGLTVKVRLAVVVLVIFIGEGEAVKTS